MSIISTRRFQNDKSCINGQVNPLEDPLLKNSSGILAQDSSTLMVLNYHVFFFCFVLFCDSSLLAAAIIVIQIKNKWNVRIISFQI